MKDDILKTDADKLFELVKKKKVIRSPAAAEKLGIENEKLIELAEILEDNGMIRLHYPPMGEPFLEFGKKEAIKKAGEEDKKPKKSRKNQFKVSGVLIAVIFLMVSVAYKNNPALFQDIDILGSFSTFYLDTNTIIIIATVFTVILVAVMFVSLKIKKKRLKEGKKSVKGRKDERREKRKKREKQKRKKPWIRKWKDKIRFRKKKTVGERIFGK